MNELFDFDDDLPLGEEKGEINLIPLLDTIFILLIFFSLLLIHASQSRVMDIELPGGEGVMSGNESELRILMDRSGAMMTRDGALLTEEALELRLHEDRPEKIILSADRDVALHRVITVMDLIEKEGLETVSIEVASP
jgi:biopolymer transport protein ExbD